MEAIQVAAESRVHEESVFHGLGRGFVGAMKAVSRLVLTTWNANNYAEKIRKYRRDEWGEDTVTEDTLTEHAYSHYVGNVRLDDGEERHRPHEHGEAF